MSFKWKISLLISVMTTVILVVTSYFVFFSFTKITHDHTKQVLDLKLKNLLARIDNNELILEPQINGWTNELDPDQFIKIMDSKGKLLYETKTNDPQVLVSEKITSICAETLFYNPGIGNLTIRLYSDAKTENKQIQLVLILLTLGTLGGTCIAAICSYLIARTTIQPINKIVQMVKTIDVHDLTHRLPNPKSKDEIYELTNTFNLLLERVDNGFELQQQFIADASHELRTPLTIIDGHANMISRWGKHSPDVIEESIGYILQETQRMRQLTQQLLYSASVPIDNAAVVSENANLINNMAEVRDQLFSIHKRSQLDIQIISECKENQVVVNIPQYLLKQVLTNVMENAVKYSLDESNINIRIYQEHPFIKVVVEDNGMGIGEEDLPHVFERFYRADKSRSKEIAGVGLGLSITRKIIERYGGRIKIDSVLNKGTNVTMFMPLSVSELPHNSITA